MNSETAKLIYERAKTFDAVLTSLLQAVETVEDEALRQQFTKAATDVMGLVFGEIMHPLELRYPNLIPDQEK